MNMTRRWQIGWLPWWGQSFLVLLTLLVGVMLARLPLLWALILLVTAILILLTLIDPLYGIVIALVLGAVLTLFYLWRRDLVANMIGHFTVDFIGNVLPRLFS